VNRVTPVSLGYPRSVFKKNSILKERLRFLVLNLCSVLLSLHEKKKIQTNHYTGALLNRSSLLLFGFLKGGCKKDQRMMLDSCASQVSQIEIAGSAQHSLRLAWQIST